MSPFPGAEDPEWQRAMHYAAEGIKVLYDPASACYKPPIIENGFGDTARLLRRRHIVQRVA